MKDRTVELANFILEKRWQMGEEYDRAADQYYAEGYPTPDNQIHAYMLGLPNSYYAQNRRRKEVSETYNEVDGQLAEQLRKRQVEADLKRKVELVDDYGDDVYEDGTVFVFQKTFEGQPYKPDGYKDDKAYTYAVIKTNNKWYTTGPMSKKGYTWEEFVLWLVGGKHPVSFSTFVLMEPVGTVGEAFDKQWNKDGIDVFPDDEDQDE